MSSQATVADPLPVVERVIGFMQLVRANEFSAGVAETLDAQHLVAACGLDQPQRIRWGLRSLVCGDHSQWQRFDELFDSYWLPANATSLQASSGAGGKQPPAREEGGGASATVSDSGQGAAADADPGGTQAGASAQESLQRADFSALVNAGQQREVEQQVELLARRLRKRLERRQVLQRRGRSLAMRPTIRQSLRYGGTPLALRFRRRREQLPRVLLITDVSRSMSLYSYFFLRFARGVLRVFSSADAFAVHSRLVPISEALRQPDSSRLAESLALISLGWSGGTRLGDSLATFNRDYGRLLNRRSLVIIISDGLDTSDPAELGRQLALVKARARRLVWLNPLLGRTGYEPLAGSMQAALPHIDLFAPAHNLESLAALERELEAL